MKLIFLSILKTHNNRKTLFSTICFIIFWWIVFCIANRRWVNIAHTVFNTTLSYIYFRYFTTFSNKNPKLSIAILKIFSFQKLSKSWKMAFSISITFQDFPKPVRTMSTLKLGVLKVMPCGLQDVKYINEQVNKALLRTDIDVIDW